MEDVKGKTLLNLTLKKVKRGSLVYTDTFRSYDGLVSYGFKHERIDHGLKFANGKGYINGIEGFWAFAKERLMKYHGIDPDKFPPVSKNSRSGIITGTTISLMLLFAR